MPHSLIAKIKGLRYKGIITDKDCDRLCNALDNENVLDKIRAEIDEIPLSEPIMSIDGLSYYGAKSINIGHFREKVFEIIDRYREGEEE
jgi:hypothetical protein